jgi:hypothetical protein
MRKCIILVFAIFMPFLLSAQSGLSSGNANEARFVPPSSDQSLDEPTAPVAGTVITMRNWRQFRRYFSDGVQELFEGKYFWKMPADVEIDIGPTLINLPPKNYVAATEKYSGQVTLLELPDGGLTMRGYRGGIPFPNPSDPHKGWKILADTYFRYMPHLTVINHAGSCSIDGNHDISCAGGDVVYRQMSFNTDPGIPATIPGFGDEFWTQWYIVTAPEQMRYTASLYLRP